MGNRFSYRPEYLAKKKLTEAKQLFKLHGKNFSMNQIINLIVIGKLKNYRLPKSLSIKNVQEWKKHSTKDRKILAESFVDLANALNILSRSFSGGFNNLNQLTRKVNSGEIKLDPNDLKRYKNLVHNSSRDIHIIEEKATKLWQRM